MKEKKTNTFIFFYGANHLYTDNQPIEKYSSVLFYFKNNQNNLPPHLQAEGPRFEPLCSHNGNQPLMIFESRVAF
jgi:hypothetical protein